MAAVEAGIKTFLIADVRGYTRFTQQRGDEAAARLATRFADLSREAIEAAGRTGRSPAGRCAPRSRRTPTRLHRRRDEVVCEVGDQEELGVAFLGYES
jgi:class 3 adenylate cyclase